MKQSRSTSLVKSIISTIVGFGISLLAQWLILPILLGAPVPLHANLAFAAIMTAISIARGYLLERFFEMLGWRVKMSPGMHAVLAERQGQKDREGWDDAHDDRHAQGELARAGACYLIHAGTVSRTPPHDWPWDGDWWKPAGIRRDLIRGVALGIAELDRFDRMRKPSRVIMNAAQVPVQHRRAL